MIRGRLRPLTKNGDNGTYALVLPIVAIFAECGTRHPSNNKFISRDKRAKGIKNYPLIPFSTL